MSRAGTVLIGLVAVLCACGGQSPPRAARLWTLDDYVALYQGGGTADGVPPLPAQTPAEKLLVDAGGGHYRLAISPTFEQLYHAAYVTTDLWQGFDEVWVQPLYLQVVDFSPSGAPQLFPSDDPRSWPIFSVGPKSRFYSPYWEVLYVKVSADSPGYKSVTDLLGDRQRLPPFRSGGARTASLFRNDLTIEPPKIDRDLNPALPPPELVGPTVRRGQGWLDGQAINYLDFGMDQFQWDANRVVAEVPLFDFAFRNDAGELQPFGGPKVGGWGPPFSGRVMPPVSDTGQPHYGGYWRLYTVVAPQSAGIFAPPQFPMFRDLLARNHVPVVDVSPEAAAMTAATLQPFVGAMAVDTTCFGSKDPVKACTWLISQDALERELDGSAIKKTDVTVTCPFVYYNDVPVNLPSPGAPTGAP